MKTKQKACLALCTYSALLSVLQLNVYTASFSHSSLFHLPYLLPDPRGRELVAPATRSHRTPLETQLLCELLLSPSLSRGGKNSPFVCKSSKRLEPETDQHGRQISCLPKSNTKEGCVVSYVKCHTHTHTHICMPAQTYNHGRAHSCRHGHTQGETVFT